MGHFNLKWFSSTYPPSPGSNTFLSRHNKAFQASLYTTQWGITTHPTYIQAELWVVPIGKLLVLSITNVSKQLVGLLQYGTLRVQTVLRMAQTGGQVSTLLVPNCVIWGRVFNFCTPQFPHLWYKKKIKICLIIVILCGWNILT